MADAPGAGDLGFSLPIWTVVNGAIYKEKGFPLALISTGSPGYGVVFPLFDREAGAAIWGATQEKGEKLEPFLITDAPLLLRLMGYSQGIDINYVALNPATTYAIAAERYVPFASVRAHFGAV